MPFVKVNHLYLSFLVARSSVCLEEAQNPKGRKRGVKSKERYRQLKPEAYKYECDEKDP